MGTFDLGAIVLYIIFGIVMGFLVYALIDIRNVYGQIRTQRYVLGLPDHKDLVESEGILEVKGDRVVFMEPSGGKEHFCIPLDRIKNVTTGPRKIDPQDRLVKRLSGLIDEDKYLYIEFQDDDKGHTLQFSAHKTSPVSDEVRNSILEAKFPHKKEKQV